MNIIGKRKLYYIFSGIIIVPGILALYFWGLKLGIDFTGGSVLEITAKNTNQEKVLEASKEKVSNVQVIASENDTYIIKFKETDEQHHRDLSSNLKEKFGSEEKKFESVGPTVSQELTRKAFVLIFVASLAIILFLAWSFRKVSLPMASWKYGVCAIVALLHDALLVLGIFSILGHFYNIEIDSYFITAILTVIGFSVHDSIVVFDRVRENLRKMAGESFSKIVNYSLNQTLARSINTSVTVLMVLLVLYLFGGESTKTFVLALLIGVASGTYSSIFNASQLLVTWNLRSEKRK